MHRIFEEQRKEYFSQEIFLGANFTEEEMPEVGLGG